jgi:GTP-binding protein
MTESGPRLLADLTQNDGVFMAAKGGKGGLGNVHFASSTNRVPLEFTKGVPGEEKEIKLDLKLLADVGIIGYPNVGKSTFLSQVTNAKPKIGNYPFTTLEPNLGVVKHKDRSFVLADIPGLIEGAAEGKGIGDLFLRHAERTQLLIHFISADSLDPDKDYETLRLELKKFNPDLATKPEIVVISRFDLLEENPDKNKILKFKSKKKALSISFNDRTNLSQLLDQMIEKIKA